MVKMSSGNFGSELEDSVRGGDAQGSRIEKNMRRGTAAGGEASPSAAMREHADRIQQYKF